VFEDPAAGGKTPAQYLKTSRRASKRLAQPSNYRQLVATVEARSLAEIWPKSSFKTTILKLLKR